MQVVIWKGAGMTSQQRQIMAAVERRGYRDGWTDDQMLVRQLFLAAAELGEAAEHVRLAHPLAEAVRKCLVAVGEAADATFKDKGQWDGVKIADTAELAGEVVDVAVVCNVFCDVAGVDMQSAAIAKAEADINRGTRYHEAGEGLRLQNG